MLNKIKTGKEQLPPRIVVYGLGGIGKSSTFTHFPKPIFIDTEGRLAHLDCAKFPQAKTLQEVKDALTTLIKEEHDYKTVVVDSLDWLESLVHEDVAKRAGVTNVAEIGYGKGYRESETIMAGILSGLTLLRDKKKMFIAATAHAQIKRFEAPDMEGYDQYRPILREGVAERMQQWCDLLMFANYQTRVKEGSDGVKRGATTGNRVFYTKEAPAYRAKDSYNFPNSIVVEDVKEVWPIISKRLKEFYGHSETKQSEPTPSGDKGSERSSGANIINKGGDRSKDKS